MRQLQEQQQEPMRQLQEQQQVQEQRQQEQLQEQRLLLFYRKRPEQQQR